jgi:hypothetical protein
MNYYASTASSPELDPIYNDLRRRKNAIGACVSTSLDVLERRHLASYTAPSHYKEELTATPVSETGSQTTTPLPTNISSANTINDIDLEKVRNSIDVAYRNQNGAQV